jgi:hypothetical protein
MRLSGWAAGVKHIATHTNSRKLRRTALYALQALLWSGVMFTFNAILGGMMYLNDASRMGHRYMGPEIPRILWDELVLGFLTALLLFWIGSVRTYLKKVREAGQFGRKGIV